MPISERQHAANRANAAKSTGLRTPEGKARSAQNARTHGFAAASFAVVRLEDLQDIAHLRDDLIAVYQPVNSQELFTLEQMALAQQEMLPAARLGSGIFTTCLDMALNHDETPFTPMSPDLVGGSDLSVDIEITRAQNRNFALADGFHRLARKDNTFPLFPRYKAQTERLYRRAVEEFKRLKKLRPELPNEPIFEVQPDENEPVSTPPDEPISNPQPTPEPVGQAILPASFAKAGVCDRTSPALQPGGPEPTAHCHREPRREIQSHEAQRFTVAARDSAFKSCKGRDDPWRQPDTKVVPAGAQHTLKKRNQPSLEDIVPHRTEGCGGVQNRFSDGCKVDVCADEADTEKRRHWRQSASHRFGLRRTPCSKAKKSSEPA